MGKNKLTDFSTYYKNYFQGDLLRFIEQIPIAGNKHYNKQEFAIQYFFLTPSYRYLEIIPTERQAHFTVSLFWIVLIDQIVYSNYPHEYLVFQRKTLYPKFIGNCTAPSLMSSQCGHHQHPRLILQAINNFNDKGNLFDFDREIFKKDEINSERPRIEFVDILKHSKPIIELELKEYFQNHQPKINPTEFWAKCELEV